MRCKESAQFALRSLTAKTVVTFRVNDPWSQLVTGYFEKEFERLAALYSTKFKRPMTLPWFVATAYDGVNLIASCARKVGAIPGAVRDCIADTKSLLAVIQTFGFNEKGSSPQVESIFQVRNGAFVHVPLK